MAQLMVIFCGVIALIVSYLITAIRLAIIVIKKYGYETLLLQDGTGRADLWKAAEYWEMYWNDEL